MRLRSNFIRTCLFLSPRLTTVADRDRNFKLKDWKTKTVNMMMFFSVNSDVLTVCNKFQRIKNTTKFQNVTEDIMKAT